MSNATNAQITALLGDAPTEQLRQLDELSTALGQAAQNATALVGTCNTLKQSAAAKALLAALKAANEATGTFLEAVEVDAYDRNGNPRWSVV